MTLNPEASQILGMYFPVLDHGFVALVDAMGNDLAVEQAARVSYGAGTRSYNETRGLLRYMLRENHTSPFEQVELKFHVKLPIFVARQLIRHRTACLAGDVMLHFDLPGGIERRGNQLYKMPISEVYRKFGKDERISCMHLRCMNEETGEVQHTQIVDVWESGEKAVYRVELSDGSAATMSKDHLCLTSEGWLRLGDAAELPTKHDATWDCALGFFSLGAGRDTGVVPQFNTIDEATETWLPVVGWEEHYEVSDQGRVRRIVGGKGARSFGRCKKVTVAGSRGVVSLNRPGYQAVEQVHQLMLEAFVGKAPPAHVGRHKDGNGLNNRIENLCWSTQQENSDDRVRDGATTRLKSNSVSVAKITYVGRQMTYDLEVAGPWHNFSAGGMVVHNSVNEYSLRYSLPSLQFYMPDPSVMGKQNKRNKQGRAEPIAIDQAQEIRGRWIDLRRQSKELYELCVAEDVDLARELARLDLPLSLYTEWYWKIDLHNCLHFLKLRCDSHAQWEIQEVSRVKAAICKRVAPIAFEAWIDYHFQSHRFSRIEMSLLRILLSGYAEAVTPLPAGSITKELALQAGLSPREWDQFLAAFDSVTNTWAFTPQDFELDLSKAKTAEYFKEEARKYLPEVKKTT